MVCYHPKDRYESAAEALQALISTVVAPPFVTLLKPIKIGDQWGYEDRTGQVVIQPQFDWAWDFSSDGLAMIKIDYLYGFIDQTGQMVIQPQFDWTP